MLIFEIFLAILGMLSVTVFIVMFIYGYIVDSLWYLTFGIACFVLCAILKVACRPNKKKRGKHFKRY